MSFRWRLAPCVAGALLLSCPSPDGAQQGTARAPALSRAVQVPAPRAAHPIADVAPLPQPEAKPDDIARRAREVLFGKSAGPADPESPEDQPALAALARETLIFDKPSYAARRIGYLRAGAVVTRSLEPVGHAGCSGGWYRVSPDGYVCVGRAATLDVEHPLVRVSARRPDRLAGLPYVYGRSRLVTPHFYSRLPARDEWLGTEPDGAVHERRAKTEGWSSAWDTAALDPMPDFLRAGRSVPLPWGVSRPATVLELGRALPGSGFAFLAFYERDGRRYGLATDFTLVALDRVTPIEPSAFHGVELGDDAALPVAFVMTRSAHVYRPAATGAGLELARPLAYREALSLSGRSRKVGAHTYLETRDGHWLKNERLIQVAAPSELPRWAIADRAWIDVSIRQQSLVAYRGNQPVYVTLVSTGADGLGDPETTLSTVRGTFLVHTKHVTATMDSDAADDEYDLRDVPYVQYFEKGYALHAAYWHDGFGAPRSHGCINLSPVDARWLFHWTHPPVPDKWHGALTIRDGTLIHIRP